MFKVQNNEEIGKYIKRLIVKKYGKQRRFCKEYVQLANLPLSDDEIRKQENRFSQILKGEKGLQITDLPICSELLGVSCEQILSCGKVSYPKGNRVTNYSVAASKSKKEWDKYINREDKLILNYDEYGKSVIDYAFEFDNYEFLKYLVDKGYIWFVDNSKDTYDGFGFGAGTSIKRRESGYHDILGTQLEYEDNLRTQMVTLAIKNHDYAMLDELHAREVPSIYMTSIINNYRVDLDKYRNDDLINAVVTADDEILDYFSSEFSILDRNGRKNTFLFPYLGDIIDEMIKRNPGKVELLIRRSVRHNKEAYKTLKARIDEVFNEQMDFNKQYLYDDKERRNRSWEVATYNLEIGCNGTMVSYYRLVSMERPHKYDGIVTNIVNVTANTQNPLLKELVLELQESYKQIVDLKEHKQ